jgi:glycosyltransferase involved in cell wall biosynthesis
MRVKIIEGMTLGKAIVSTSIGVEGIIHQDRKDVFICDSAGEFISAINILINEKTTFDSLSINAHKSVNQNYSNTSLTDKLIKFLKSI